MNYPPHDPRNRSSSGQSNLQGHGHAHRPLESWREVSGIGHGDGWSTGTRYSYPPSSEHPSSRSTYSPPTRSSTPYNSPFSNPREISTSAGTPMTSYLNSRRDSMTTNFTEGERRWGDATYSNKSGLRPEAREFRPGAGGYGYGAYSSTGYSAGYGRPAYGGYGAGYDSGMRGEAVSFVPRSERHYAGNVKGEWEEDDFGP